jgi:calcium/proton exchanger cax
MSLKPSIHWLFVFIPIARLIVLATEQLATRTGDTVGGLLNATFGNAPELIIALMFYFIPDLS